MPVHTSVPSIANDLKVAGQSSILGLAQRNKLPDILQNPGMFDQFVESAAEMVLNLPVYITGGVVGGLAGGAAGSEVPVVGNVIGAGVGGSVGAFALPAIMRKILIDSIQKGDVNSFSDLMDRALGAGWAGAKEVPAGVAGYLSGELAIPARAVFGPGVGAGTETMLKLAQQGVAIDTISSLSKGQTPTASGMAVDTAFMIAMHYTLGEVEKATDQVNKVHSRVQDEYVKSGIPSGAIAAEALRRQQESPVESVIDRINEITRPATQQTQQEAPTAPQEPSEKAVVPEPAPPSLRPAIREEGEGGKVTPGGPGEVHPDIVERSKDGERGFVTPDDQFLTRDEAKAWLHENEPEQYELWVKEAGSPEEEFHTTDYNAAVQKSTGIKNAAVDVQREQRGLPPLESDQPTKRADVYAQAKEDVISGKVNPMQLADAVINRNVALTDSQVDAINYYERKLSNDANAAREAILQARANDDPQAEQRARDHLQGIENEQDIIERAARKTGTTSARALRARQEMLKEDYSIDRVLLRARAASKTGEISPEIRDQLETLTTQFKEANDRLEAYMNKQSSTEGQRTIDNLKRETERTQRKEVRKQDRIALDTEFDSLLKSFDSLVSRMSANPFADPELLSVVGKMARNRVASGLTRFEDVRDYIHDKLTDIGHEFTKREIGDVISGYGKTIEMSKEAIATALREVRRQGKLVSALEDAQAELLPLRSGLQRDKVSDRVRELQQQVKQAMRESGIKPESSKTPEEQWRSALDAVKTRLRNQIKDLKAGRVSPERKGIELDAEAKGLKDELTNLQIKAQQASGELDLKLRKMLQTLEGKPGVSPERKLQLVMDATQRSIDEYNRRIKENDLTPTQRKSGVPETPELKALREQRDLLQETYRQMKEAATPKKSAEETALDRYKKHLETRIADMERQYATNDFSQEPHKPIVLDQEATDMKVKAEKLRQRIDDQIAKQKREARSTTEKVIDTATKWRRFGLLSGWNTLSKLTKAAMDRMGITPIEELIGGVLSEIPGISKISSKALMHGGGLDISAEVKAVSQLWDKATAKDMWEELAHGQDSLDLLFGGKARLPNEVLGLFGQLHGALKVPEKRAEFFRRFEIGMEQAKRNNLDVNDPRIQSVIGLRSYMEAERAILMQPNFATDAYNVMLAALHNKGILGKTAEAGLRFIFPMVRVATNLPGEAISYTPPALIAQGVQAVRVFKLLTEVDKNDKSTFDMLTMHDADNVMRGLKKGTVGLGLMAIGFAFRKNITGYYLTEGDKKRGVKRGIMKIGKTVIPAYLNDTPPLIAIQLAATVGHVWDHYNMKGMSGGLIAGAAQATMELAKRVPFYGQTLRTGEATQTPERAMTATGGFLGSLLIPRLVSEIAEATDKDKKRVAKTPTEAIKMQIPGLRKTVHHHLRAR